jgi:hypothetical protein
MEYLRLLEEIAFTASSLAGGVSISPYSVRSYFDDGFPVVMDETENGHPEKWSYFVFSEKYGFGESSGLMDSRQHCIEALAQILADKISQKDEEETKTEFKIIAVVDNKLSL